MSSCNENNNLPQSPFSSNDPSQSQKKRLSLKAVRRMRNFRPSPSPASPDSGEKIGNAIRAIVSNNGAEIVVDEQNDAIRLYATGNFGSFVGQRMNFANVHCFLTDSAEESNEQLVIGSEPSAEKDHEGEEDTTKKAKESAAEWIERTTGGGGLLHLSAEEALYLSHDLAVLTLASQRTDVMLAEYSPEQFVVDLCAFQPNFSAILCRYVVYRYFRRLGWIVRDGISFGADFLLYKRSVDAYHSSAGVRIINSDNEPIVSNNSIGALQRELANCKKRLLLARVVGLTPRLQNLRLQQLEMADVQVLSMSVWNMNRSRITDLSERE